MEELYGATAQTHAAELSHHFIEAELVLGPAKLAHYSLLAGDQALASYAYEDALTHFEKGLVDQNTALAGTEVAPDEEAAALLLGLARVRPPSSQGLSLWKCSSI